MTSRDDVVDFLRLFKGCIMLDLLHVKDREKNRQALIDLGITPDERQEALLGLEPANYVSGPMPDETDDTKEVWVFGKEVLAAEVYIKLRVVQDSKHKNAYRAMVWSFHPAEYTMKYPLQRGGS